MKTGLLVLLLLVELLVLAVGAAAEWFACESDRQVQMRKNHHAQRT